MFMCVWLVAVRDCRGGQWESYPQAEGIIQDYLPFPYNPRLLRVPQTGHLKQWCGLCLEVGMWGIAGMNIRVSRSSDKGFMKGCHCQRVCD